MTTAAIQAQAPAGKDILGHPRGLWYLVFCEGFERFSYYGMQSLLVLYLTQYLLLPGHMDQVAALCRSAASCKRLFGQSATPVATATAITGLYSGRRLSHADHRGVSPTNWLGRTKMVSAGGA